MVSNKRFSPFYPAATPATRGYPSLDKVPDAGKVQGAWTAMRCQPLPWEPLERLMNYDWPGNVRELQNIVERELIRYRGGSLTFESLVSPLHAKKEQPSSDVGREILKPVSLDEAMAQHIRKVIEFAKGRINGKGGAAELLRINPSTLRSRMEKLGVNRTEF